MSPHLPTSDPNNQRVRALILAELRRALSDLDIHSPEDALREVRALRYGGRESITRVTKALAALTALQRHDSSSPLTADGITPPLGATFADGLSLFERRVVERLMGLHPTTPPPDVQETPEGLLETRGSGRFLGDEQEYAVGSNAEDLSRLPGADVTSQARPTSAAEAPPSLRPKQSRRGRAPKR